MYKVGKLHFFVPWSFCVDLPTAPWVWGKWPPLAVRCFHHIFQQCSRKHDLSTSKDAEIEKITIDYLYMRCEFCMCPQFDKLLGRFGYGGRPIDCPLGLPNIFSTVQVWSTRAQESPQLLLLLRNFWPPKMRFGGQNCWLKVCFSK